MKLQKIIDVIEKIAPPENACEWDNVGLMIGNPDCEISRVVISLDFDENAVKTAVENNANLIITHHPAIFKPLSRITDKLIIETIKNDICVYSAHTNFDCAVGGVNYALAEKIEMYDCVQYDMMRVGRIKEASLSNVVNCVKEKLDTSSVRVVGDLDKPIKKVAVLGGSGGDFTSIAFNLGCDLLVTGECKYNDAQEAHKLGISVIAAGHFETEYPAVKKLADVLKTRIDVDIIEAKPFNVYRSI